MEEFNVQKKYTDTASRYVVMEQRKYLLTFNYNEVIRILESKKFDRVVDIGCGSGVLIRKLATEYPDIQFLGIDFCQELLDIGKSQTQCSNIQFRYADIISYHTQLIDDYSLLNHKVLFLLLGPMEHYHVHDTFAQAIYSIWQKTPSATLLITYHNRNFFLHKLFKRKEKRYWTDTDSIQLFFHEGVQMRRQRYFHFFIFAFLVSGLKMNIGHNGFLYIEKIIAQLPDALNKYIFVSLLHVFEKQKHE